ncbi:unnamed protein product [Brassica oleracea]
MIKGLRKLTSAHDKNQLYKQGILGLKSFMFEYSYLQRLIFLHLYASLETYIK